MSRHSPSLSESFLNAEQVRPKPVEEPAPDAEPEAEQPDPAFTRGVTAEMNERVKGFQRVVASRDTRIANLQAQLSEIRPEQPSSQHPPLDSASLDGLTDEQRMLFLARDYPHEVATLERILRAESHEQIVSILSEFMEPDLD